MTDISYNKAIDTAINLIVKWIEEDPARASGPVEDEIEYVYDPENLLKGPFDAKVLSKGWYSRMKEDGVDLRSLGLSGFQWNLSTHEAKKRLGLV